MIVCLVRKGVAKAITADSFRHKADVEVTGPFLACFEADRTGTSEIEKVKIVCAPTEMVDASIPMLQSNSASKARGADQ